MILPELTIIPREIGKFVSDAGFDGAYDFSVMRVRDVFGKGEDVGLLSLIAREAKQYYPEPQSMLAPIDNYEDAFALIAREPKGSRTRLALTYLLTLDRVPLLYAGDEMGIAFREVGGAFRGDRRGSPFLKGEELISHFGNASPHCAGVVFQEVLLSDSIYAFLRETGDDQSVSSSYSMALNGRANLPIQSAIVPGAIVNWKTS